MRVLKAYRYKLRPTPSQKNQLRQFGGAARWVYNTLLDQRITAYQNAGKSLSYSQQAKQLTQWKRTDEFGWLKTIHSQVLQQAAMDLDQAFKNFFKRRHQGVGFPRFKQKRHINDSFRYPQGVKIKHNRVYLPKMGWVRFFKSRDVPSAPRSVTVKQQASGWYVSILCEVEIPDVQPLAPTMDNSVGVDVGIKSLIVTSDGDEFTALSAYRNAEKKLAKAQKALSRKTRGSHRYRKQRRRVARLHERIRNIRKNYAHNVTTWLVRNYDAIFVEDLHIAGMLKNRKLSKSLADAAMGTILRMLAWKCKEHGVVFQKISRWFPSSKTCHVCGQINDTLALSDRDWSCSHCGTLHDRDINAAKNIQREGLHVAAGQTET